MNVAAELEKALSVWPSLAPARRCPARCELPADMCRVQQGAVKRWAAPGMHDKKHPGRSRATFHGRLADTWIRALFSSKEQPVCLSCHLRDPVFKAVFPRWCRGPGVICGTNHQQRLTREGPRDEGFPRASAHRAARVGLSDPAALPLNGCLECETTTRLQWRAFGKAASTTWWCSVESWCQARGRRRLLAYRWQNSDR